MAIDRYDKFTCDRCGDVEETNPTSTDRFVWPPGWVTITIMAVGGLSREVRQYCAVCATAYEAWAAGARWPVFTETTSVDELDEETELIEDEIARALTPATVLQGVVAPPDELKLVVGGYAVLRKPVRITHGRTIISGGAKVALLAVASSADPVTWEARPLGTDYRVIVLPEDLTPIPAADAAVWVTATISLAGTEAWIDDQPATIEAVTDLLAEGFA